MRGLGFVTLDKLLRVKEDVKGLSTVLFDQLILYATYTPLLFRRTGTRSQIIGNPCIAYCRPCTFNDATCRFISLQKRISFFLVFSSIVTLECLQIFPSRQPYIVHLIFLSALLPSLLLLLFIFRRFTRARFNLYPGSKLAEIFEH